MNPSPTFPSTSRPGNGCTCQALFVNKVFGGFSNVATDNVSGSGSSSSSSSRSFTSNGTDTVSGTEVNDGGHKAASTFNPVRSNIFMDPRISISMQQTNHVGTSTTSTPREPKEKGKSNKKGKINNNHLNVILKMKCFINF